jgi:hypothetical protein
MRVSQMRGIGPARSRALLEFPYAMGENRRVTQLTEPQVWVLIGVFGAAFVGLIGIVTTTLNRTMNARFEGMNYRFEAMEARVDSKFDLINTKLENMDRDIQALSRHVFGSDPRG